MFSIFPCFHHTCVSSSFFLFCITPPTHRSPHPPPKAFHPPTHTPNSTIMPASTFSTPTFPLPSSMITSNKCPLSLAEARLYRACAVRENYLALGRVDVAFAAKELYRLVSFPVWLDLKSSGVGALRLVCHFVWQQEEALHAHVDTDYSRRS